MPTLFTMNADVNDFLSPNLSAASELQIHFDLNITTGAFLKVDDTVRPSLMAYTRVIGYIRSDGRMYDTEAVSAAPYDLEDPGNLGVRLLGDDPDLNLGEDHVTYTVRGFRTVYGKRVQFGPYETIPVPATDISVHLANFLVPEHNALEKTSHGILQGAVGYYVETNRMKFALRAVPILTGPDAGKAQWVDGFGNEIGAPVTWDQVISTEVAWAAASAAAPEAVADAAGELEPTVETGPTPGKVRMRWSDIIVGPEFNPLPAAIGSIAAPGSDDGKTAVVAGGNVVARNPKTIDPTLPPYNIKFDRYTTTQMAMSSSVNPTHLTVTGYTFDAKDVGKLVKVERANLRTFTATTLNGSPTVSAVSSVTDLYPGTPVSGPGIPADTKVRFYDAAAGTVTLTKNATASASGVTLTATTSLKTSITGHTAGKAILAAPCLSTVTDTFGIFATDNKAGLDLLFNDLSNTSRTKKLSKVVDLPAGSAAAYTGTLTAPLGGTVRGVAENFVNTDIIFGAKGNGSEDAGGAVLYQLWDQNVDGMRFREPYATGESWGMWFGRMSGFAMIQDRENTAGKGMNLVRADGAHPLRIIDGGQLERIGFYGWAEQGLNVEGSLPASFRDLNFFACGYAKRKDFFADVLSGSQVLSNVSNTTGLAVFDLMVGPGIATDTHITGIGLDGPNTVRLSRPATGTNIGAAVQKRGVEGFRYKILDSETVNFDHLSGDQCAGGLLRIVGPGGAFGIPIGITALKSEFGTNVYREARLDTVFPGEPSFPQQANAVVLENVTRGVISIRDFVHWADTSSSIGGLHPNSRGGDIGAAILDLYGATTPDITWEALVVRGTAGSGQTEYVAYRDCRSSTTPAILVDVSGKGTNRPRPAGNYRAIYNQNITIRAQDTILSYATLTGPRTLTLPLLSQVGVGRSIILQDPLGLVTPTNTLTLVSDTTTNPGSPDPAVMGPAVLSSARGQIVVTKVETAVGVYGWYAVESKPPTLTATATLDHDSINTLSHNDKTMALPGAVVGDVVRVQGPMLGGVIFEGFVTAPDVVTVRARNVSSGTIDPSSNTFTAKIIR